MKLPRFVRRAIDRSMQVPLTTWLRAACMLTLVALALMVWSLLEPTPLPVMVAMSVGQGLGTIAFGIFGWVVFKDLTRARAERKSLDRISLVNIELPRKHEPDQEKTGS